MLKSSQRLCWCRFCRFHERRLVRLRSVSYSPAKHAHRTEFHCSRNTYKCVDRDRTWDFRPLEKLGPEAGLRLRLHITRRLESVTPLLRPQPECFHSPTHARQSSIISLCACWASVSCRRHGGGSRGSYNIKAATLGGIVRSTTECLLVEILGPRDQKLRNSLSLRSEPH